MRLGVVREEIVSLRIGSSQMPLTILLLEFRSVSGRQIAARAHREYMPRGLWSVRDDKDRVMRMWPGEAGRAAESRRR